MTDPYQDWYATQRRMVEQVALEKVRQAREVERAAAAVRARAAAAARQLDDDAQEAVRLMDSTQATERLTGYKLCAATIARRNGFTVIEPATMPHDANAYFNERTRTAYVPPITGADTFAVRLHEFGHGIAGACPQTPPHQRDPAEPHWWNCVACETAAWEQAQRLAPFDRTMFQQLQRSLAAYRRTTQAPAAAVAAARHIASDSVWAQRLQDRVRREIQYAEICAAARDAARPRPLRRWEIQYAEIIGTEV